MVRLKHNDRIFIHAERVELVQYHSYFFIQSGGKPASPQWAVREGDWKLLHNPVGDALFSAEEGGERLYLFNIHKDVGERQNVADINPEIVKRLRGRWEKWLGG